MALPVIVVKQEGRRPLFIQVRDPIDIGRECDGIIIADPKASRLHARLTPEGDEVLVEDLGSTNGTFVGSQKVTSARLEGDAIVRIGNSVLQLADAALPPARATSDFARGTMIGEPEDVDMDRPRPVSGPVRAINPEQTDFRETSIEAVAREVSQSHTPLTDVETDSGTITIVFSDIESSTERATAMGDTDWMEVLASHNEIITRHVRNWKGSVVKNQGDGFMMTFGGARRALHAMVAVQNELEKYAQEHPEKGVRVRVGVHTGEVIAEKGDIFGKHVMLAARVGGLADGGEILVSSIVREITSARGDLDFGEPRTTTLKGIDGEHTVYPLLWEQFEPQV
ncbi:MAG TPA: adenylate/guanylate cyclase domain-containing protein [Acidimicrobiales bacterium]|nr:adenylate/guanylate cyclase domain-containing protein [Acidimicrobiales bacterium]